MSKDWSGNKKSTHVTLGSSNHSEHERESHDYYATEPVCAVELMQVANVHDVWECACGEGHLAKVFDVCGVLSKATDLIDRGYGQGGVNFMRSREQHDGWIVTNPPYKYALEFTEHALTLAPHVAMFLKLTFLEGQKRKKFFERHPPKYIYVYSSRRKCAMNGEFEDLGSSAACYAWFIWERGFTGDSIVRWI
jgi:hypothetical protein